MKHGSTGLSLNPTMEHCAPPNSCSFWMPYDKYQIVLTRSQKNIVHQCFVYFFNQNIFFQIGLATMCLFIKAIHLINNLISNNSTLEKKKHKQRLSCQLSHNKSKINILVKESFHAKINKTVYLLLFPAWFIFY